jgi:hypothetical protein
LTWSLAIPDLVSTAVVHEPPILELLDDPDAWVARFAGIFATYQTAGLWPAMAQFGQAVGLPGGPAGPQPGAEVAPEIAAMLARIKDNMTFWMEHEFRQYPAYHPDLDALAAVAEKIVPAGTRARRGICLSCPLSRSPGGSAATLPSSLVAMSATPSTLATSPLSSTGCSARIGEEPRRRRMPRCTSG